MRASPSDKAPAWNQSMTAIVAVSGAAILFLFWIIYGAAPLRSRGEGAFALSTFNAFCNAVTTVLLISGVLAIKKGNELRHRRRMLAAFLSSSCFLTGYILYHTLFGDSRYPGEGWLRPVYFFILISHIVLSLPALPMVLITFYLGLTDKKALHRRWAKFTFPIWLYVSVTGVLVYLLLKQAEFYRLPS